MAERGYVAAQDHPKQTTVGEWREVTLGECAELIRESASPSLMGDALYIGLEHIGEGTLSLLGQGVATDVTSTKARFQSGDILFGKLRPYFRKVVRAPANGLCSTDIWVVRARDGVDQGYLYYCMASQQFVDFATAGSEGTKMPRAIWEHVSRYEIPLPPLHEQRAIAHVLGTLDDKIELNRRMNETLEEMARALFKSWFVDFDPVRAKMDGRLSAARLDSGQGQAGWRRGESLPGLSADLYDLFPARLVDSELGESPEGWEVKALGELVELAYGKALRAVDREDGPVPVYGSNGQVGWHDANLVAGPGIVVGRKGNPGIVTWAHGDFFPIDTTFYVVPRDANGGMPFLFFALTWQDLPSVSADSAVPGLNRNLAYMNKQLVPDEQVLAEFNDYASALFSRRHRLEQESRELTAQRDALLPWLVFGEIGVKTE